MDILEQISSVNTILSMGYNLRFEKQILSSKMFDDEIKSVIRETGGYDRVDLMKTRLRIIAGDIESNRTNIAERARTMYERGSTDEKLREIVADIDDLPSTCEFNEARMFANIIKQERLFL